MSNRRLTIAIIMKSLLILCLYGFSFNNAIAADGASASKAETATATKAVKKVKKSTRKRRDKDAKCLKCHNSARVTQHETHGQAATDILGKPVTCESCHNKVGTKHRNGAKKVTKYSSAQSQPGTKKKLLTQDEVFKANKECVECHDGKSLQKASWTHDVHALNLTCSNCHDIHVATPESKKIKNKARLKKKNDTGVNILQFDNHKEIVGMCVDCHSDFNAINAKKEDK